MSTNIDFSDAISTNAVASVRELLRHGEEPDDYACSLAIQTKANAVLGVLIQAGANVNGLEGGKGGYTHLASAIRERNAGAFRLLLKAGASINKRGNGRAPLHIAAEKGLIKFVKFCIAAGAQSDQRDGSGNTALMLAAVMGHVGVVRCLLKGGANPCVVHRLTGRTACELATENGEADVVKLLEPVSRRSSPRKRGVPALIEAISKLDIAAVDELLASGVDVDGRDIRGWSALDKAIEMGSIPLVERLIQAGISLNRVARDGTSYLEGALRAEKWEIAKLLLQAGALPNPPGKRLGDAIGTAIYSNDTELLKLLVSRGSNPKARGLLIDAARAKRVNSVRFLVSKGADVNERDSMGSTPLMWAAFDPLALPGVKGRQLDRKKLSLATAPEPNVVRELVKLLIEHGADVELRDELGRTAFSLAGPAGAAAIKESARRGRGAG